MAIPFNQLSKDLTDYYFSRGSFHGEYANSKPKTHVVSEQRKTVLVGLCNYEHETIFGQGRLTKRLPKDAELCRRCAKVLAERKLPTLQKPSTPVQFHPSQEAHPEP